MDLDSAILYSHDITKIIPFYRDTLGFKLEYEQPGKFVSFIFQGGGRLGVKTTSEEREKPGHQTVFISDSQIEATYQKIKDIGLKLYTEITEKPWGKEFSLLDPDGNKVLFIRRNA